MQKCLVVSHPSDLRESDLYEYRFDRFPFKKEHIRYPAIFTLRSQDQGGAFCGSEREREQRFREILELKPTWVDLEYNAGFTLPGKKLISYHNFKETPQTFPKADKIACQARSILDALRLLTYGQKNNVLTLGMGEHGLITRLFAKPWTYIGPESLMDEHLYDPSKPLYGLIGGKVEQSPSHKTHNQLDICYIKMVVQPHELAEFFTYYHLFNGLSVTVPLKEKVLPFITPDLEAAEIGAVNTIDRRLCGYNTDGKGALDALGPVANKRVHIMGAGGSARAIAFEAKQRGAIVSIENRDRQKAEVLAKKWGLILGRSEYDILVNTTPEMPLFVPGTTVMDIRLEAVNFPKEAKKCRIIPGFEMFINQAKGQFERWQVAKNVKSDIFS